MLRNRSRAVSSKQAIMADNNHICNKNHTKPISSSFLGSPRSLFNGFLSRNISSHEILSPTSILESKHFSNFTNLFTPEQILPKTQKDSAENKPTYNKLDSESIGLAIIDSIKDEKNIESNLSNPKKMVLFGAKLKVQIPSCSEFSSQSVSSPKSPAEFGIKTRSTHTSVVSQSKHSPQAFNVGKLSLSEMELSEDYTCVITHGPNPKTIHIFDNCVVNDSCKDDLQQGKEIHVHRGEEAFCSNECRCQEMLSEGEK